MRGDHKAVRGAAEPEGQARRQKREIQVSCCTAAGSGCGYWNSSNMSAGRTFLFPALRPGAHRRIMVYAHARLSFPPKEPLSVALCVTYRASGVGLSTLWLTSVP